MASEYKQFTNEGFDVEGVGHGDPPSYDESDAIPSSAPPQNPYPPPNSSEYPMQQPSKSQQASQFPQQQPGTYAPQQQPGTYAPQQQPGTYDPQQQPGTYDPQQHPGTYDPQQQPGTYAPQQQPGTYAPQPQVVQVPIQQNIVHVSPMKMPNDYFALALVTLCCCLPFGIVALIKSTEVRNRSAVGDYHGAAVSSLEAKRWSRIGIMFGIISGLVTIVYAILHSSIEYGY
ncbi:proline-rich transmembrane protein 1 [Strongylocentrotus purpuratus]|uniref:Uncharacterized protein n=1 Tax=Strongylocentrotus purpuratus TaxID=7668 RepID=A0A7M7PFM8_STRPU|nr:proline-rich transmembrane protein 1 [Strongylocentrotus purpuratus]